VIAHNLCVLNRLHSRDWAGVANLR
jgi:hypothetical protein